MSKEEEPEMPVERRSGRILRVKQGYNPNSSSMGSIVFSLPVMLLGAGALFAAAAGILFSALGGPRKKGSDDGPAPDDEAPAEGRGETRGTGEPVS